ncbi:MAG: beta-galactosidase [Rhodospirillales bacterium]|nr:beta-galactosidase [Rhodospirillales bacterium]
MRKRIIMAIAVLLAALVPRLAAASPWRRFEVILWHDHGPAALAGARRVGVTAAMMLGQREAFDAAALRARAEALLAAGLGCYVENIATDLYAAYHRWEPGRSPSWRFARLQAEHRRDPADVTVWLREPSLSDPVWLARISARLQAHVAALTALHPLFYSLGDETGIGDLAAAWDFDTGPDSLAAFRAWLREQYGTLAALNREWGSDFARWDAVVPMLTTAAIARRDGDLAAWSDFKAWMDVAFARALAVGTAAMHAADPAARAAIEGAQIPGWGGYDYTQLVGAVDVMEIYDGADNIEMADAFNPALVLLTTLGGGAGEVHELWHDVLLGTRGVVLWDPDGGVVGADGTPGARGRALAPAFAALQGEAGRRLLASRPVAGPVGILYSPASERIGWLLDRQAEAAAGGPDWTMRDAETEWGDNAARAARRGAAQGLMQRAIMPRWLTPADLGAGQLAANGIKVLLLPRAIALSDAEVAAIRAFAGAGGVVLAVGPPGAFDAHGRRRPAPPLADAARQVAAFDASALGAALQTAGVAPPLRLTRPDGAAVADVEIRLRRDGDTLLLGLLRQPVAPAAAPAEEVVLSLQRPGMVRDLLADAPARRAERLVLHLSADRPALLALTQDDGVAEQR